MRRFAKTPLAAAGLAAVLLAAPVQAFWGDRVVNDYIDDAYLPNDVSIFAAGGGQAAIYGATSDGAGAAEIASQIRLPAAFSPRAITAGPTGRREGPHLVLVFAPQGTTPRAACRGEAKGGVAAPSELKVLGDFCRGYGRPVSEAVLLADGAETPSNPDFGRTMATLVNKLLPFRNPNFQGDDSPFMSN